MIPFVLPLVLLIAEDCSLQEFGELVMPVLIPALSIQDPVQVGLFSSVSVWRIIFSKNS